MTIESISWLDIATLIISLVGLFGVVYQSINLQKTINNQIYDSFIRNSLEIDKLLIEYPEIREYVYEGKEVNSKTPQLNRIMSFVELIVDCTENIEVYKKYIPKSRKDGWLKFVADTQKTPAYKYYISKYGSWFEVKK